MPSGTRVRTVYRLAALFVFVTVLLGGMVCATDSSSACPAWPVCYGDRVGPELRPGWLENPVIEFVHRAISFAALVFLAWSGWLGRRSSDVRLRILPWIALVGALGAAVFGMMVILFTLPLGLAMLDLGLALVAMCLSAISASAFGTRRAEPRATRSQLIGITLGLLIVMHLLGSFVAGTTSAGTGSFTRCISWPLWQVLEIDSHPVLQVLRIVMAGLAGVLIVLIAAAGVRNPRIRTISVALLGMLAVELVLGAVILSQGLDITQTNGINLTVAVAYSAAAVAIMWLLAELLGRHLPAVGHDGEPMRQQVTSSSSSS